MATPLTEYHSLKGLQIFYEYLPRAVKNGADMEAREQMMLGCIIAGFGFSNANLGLVHGIAHTLSAHFHLAHGMANATVLPYVMEYNADSCPEKMVELARAIHLPVTGNVEEDKYLLSAELLKLTKELGIKTLSQQGIEEKDLREHVEKLRMDMKEHQVTMAVGMIWKEHGPKDIDLLLNESERLMYEDKDRYYKEHGLKRRR